MNQDRCRYCAECTCPDLILWVRGRQKAAPPVLDCGTGPETEHPFGGVLSSRYWT